MISICELCGQKLVHSETRRVGRTTYQMLKCEGCNRVVAKNIDS